VSADNVVSLTLGYFTNLMFSPDLINVRFRIAYQSGILLHKK